MTARAITLVAALLAFALWLARGATVTAPPAAPAAQPAGGQPANQRPAPAQAPDHVARDPFRYAEVASRPPVQTLPAAPVVTAPRPTPPPPSPVRLVGFVRRAGQLRAVLSVLGITAVVAAGEDAEGYHVLAVDEEGVRLRSPSGEELSLRPSAR